MKLIKLNKKILFSLFIIFSSSFLFANSSNNLDSNNNKLNYEKFFSQKYYLNQTIEIKKDSSINSTSKEVPKTNIENQKINDIEGLIVFFMGLLGIVGFLFLGPFAIIFSLASLITLGIIKKKKTEKTLLMKIGKVLGILGVLMDIIILAIITLIITAGIKSTY